MRLRTAQLAGFARQLGCKKRANEHDDAEPFTSPAKQYKRSRRKVVVVVDDLIKVQLEGRYYVI